MSSSVNGNNQSIPGLGRPPLLDPTDRHTRLCQSRRQRKGAFFREQPHAMGPFRLLPPLPARPRVCPAPLANCSPFPKAAWKGRLRRRSRSGRPQVLSPRDLRLCGLQGVRGPGTLTRKGRSPQGDPASAVRTQTSRGTRFRQGLWKPTLWEHLCCPSGRPANTSRGSC